MKIEGLITRPCDAPEGALVKTQRGLHCRSCEMDIVELWHLTEREASALVRRAREHGERVCVRAVVNARRDVVLAQERFVPVERLRRVAASIAVAASLAATACEGSDGVEKARGTSSIGSPQSTEIAGSKQPRIPSTALQRRQRWARLFGQPAPVRERFLGGI